MIDVPGVPRFEISPHHCFACGTLNTNGLGLDLHVERGRSWVELTYEERFQGWDGIAHGGILATILDEVMAWALVGEDNWVKGGTFVDDTMAGGGGLVYPTGAAYVPGSTSRGGTTGDVAHVMSSDATSPYATWVANAQISGKLREGFRPGGDHVTSESLVGYDSPYA